VTNDDIRQIVEDVVAPIKTDLTSVKISVDKMERTSISRMEYDPRMLSLQTDIRRLRRSLAVMRRKQENQWRQLILTVATVGGAILVLFQLAAHVTLR
jgi:hypothetical protein